MTPLLMAAGNGSFMIVRYLVEQGADKNKADNYGTTPLRAALARRHTEVAAYLRAAGAK